ncbi:unnamed protein product [Caenorhabditis brenneri]
MKLLILLLIVLSTSAYPFPDTPDGSEKLIQGWIDDLHKAIQSKNKTAIGELFNEDAHFAVCEKDQERNRWDDKWRRGDELVEYLANNGSEAVFYVNAAVGRRDEIIMALLTVTGLGPEFVSTDMRFENTGKLRFAFGEYLACGWGSVNRLC